MTTSELRERIARAIPDHIRLVMFEGKPAVEAPSLLDAADAILALFHNAAPQPGPVDRERIDAAIAALKEAEDKFHIAWCNYPKLPPDDGTIGARHARENHEMLRQKSNEMGEAWRALLRTTPTKKET